MRARTRFSHAHGAQTMVRVSFEVPYFEKGQRRHVASDASPKCKMDHYFARLSAGYVSSNQPPPDK